MNLILRGEFSLQSTRKAGLTCGSRTGGGTYSRGARRGRGRELWPRPVRGGVEVLAESLLSVRHSRPRISPEALKASGREKASGIALAEGASFLPGAVTEPGFPFRERHWGSRYGLARVRPGGSWYSETLPQRSGADAASGPSSSSFRHIPSQLRFCPHAAQPPLPGFSPSSDTADGGRGGGGWGFVRRPPGAERASFSAQTRGTR